MSLDRGAGSGLQLVLVLISQAKQYPVTCFHFTYKTVCVRKLFLSPSLAGSDDGDRARFVTGSGTRG